MSAITSPGGDLHLVSPLIAGIEQRAAETTESSSADLKNWEHLIEEIERMRTLTEDWDGQGAEAPVPSAVDWALEWVRQMRLYRQAIPPSRAVPGVAGELYLEWQGESFHLVAEIVSHGRVEWTLSRPGQTNHHWLTEGRLPHFLTLAR